MCSVKQAAKVISRLVEKLANQWESMCLGQMPNGNGPNHGGHETLVIWLVWLVPGTLMTNTVAMVEAKRSHLGRLGNLQTELMV